MNIIQHSNNIHFTFMVQKQEGNMSLVNQNQ